MDRADIVARLIAADTLPGEPDGILYDGPSYGRPLAELQAALPRAEAMPTGRTRDRAIAALKAAIELTELDEAEAASLPAARTLQTV